MSRTRTKTLSLETEVLANKVDGRSPRLSSAATPPPELAQVVTLTGSSSGDRKLVPARFRDRSCPPVLG